MEFLEHRELMAADAPTLGDASKSVHLNVSQTSYTFKLADFSTAFHDAGGNSLTQIQIASLPANGELSLNGSTAVTVGQNITLASIPSLTYFFDVSKTYTGSDVFTWSATDSAGQTSASANFTLVLADKAPTLSNISKTVQSRTSPRFNTADFTSIFKDADAGDAPLQVQIKTVPLHGTLSIIGGDATNKVVNNGNFGTVQAGDVIALGQLANLIYTPTIGYTGSDSFTFNARDLEQFAATDASVLINVTAAPNLLVTGGGRMIANHSTSTAANNFTDFGGMTTTPDSTLGTDTRTFLIVNNGNTTINLTGGKGKFVQISGPQAADFKVITPPATSVLAAGQSTTFTVQFAPIANDTRTATLTIPNSTGTPYSFAISGTGLITTSSFVSSSFSSVDQGTVVQGTGEAAFIGEQLTVSYSGFVLNYQSSTSVPPGLAGIVFDSTTNEGGQPFSFVLGEGQVITGWDAALAGMKVGETRVLLIPAAAAYSSTGSGAIPANASLEFTVTLLKITKPTIVVSGSDGTAITSGKNTPSIANGTDFGTLPAKTVSSSAHAFIISPKDVGFVSAATISVAGANPDDFIVTQAAGKTARKVFSVTFKPTLAGLRTAIIHVKSGIATNPDYTFTVQGNSSAYTDITPSLADATGLPATVVLHATPTFTVPLTIRNIGTSALPAGAATDVHFFLKNTATGTQTDFTQATSALSAAGLGASAAKTFNISLKLPASLAAGNYALVAVINRKKGITETLATNDTITSTQTFNVEPVTTDLGGKLVSDVLPTSLTALQPINGNITVTVDNAGNQKMPNGQQITLTVVAKNLITGETSNLTVSGPLSVSGLAGHTGFQFTVPVNDAKGLPAGSYNYQVLIKPVQTLAQSTTANDLITKTASNTTLGLKVAQPDISATLGDSSLTKTIKAGGSTTEVGTVGIVITNTTAANLPANEMVKIAILAHPLAGGSDITLVPAGTEYSIASLAATSNMTVNVGVSFTGAHFTAGQYRLQAQVTLVPAVTESNTANNLASLTAANETISLTATA